MILESARLVFRPHDHRDLEAYCEMEADTEVRRYVGETARPREEAVRRFKSGLEHASEELSLKAVVLKSNQRYIGRASLYPHLGAGGPIPGEASISFYLAKAYWGQGLATEAASIFLDYGFKVLSLSRIVTTIDSRNAASRRVLEKLGFQLFEREEGSRKFEKYEILRTQIAN